MRRIAVAEPTFSGNEKVYVLDCLESTWISSVGKYIPLFEQAVARVSGARHAIVTNNGTTALHLALVALGVGPGDEVLVHGAEIRVPYGETHEERRKATIKRATWFEQAWVRMTGDLEYMELLEFSFSGEDL